MAPTTPRPRCVQFKTRCITALSFIRSLIIDKTKLDVEVTIGVQRPEQVDLEKVKNSLPVGNVTVTAIKGGLDVADPENNDPAVIASAAIAVRTNRGLRNGEPQGRCLSGFGLSSEPRPRDHALVNSRRLNLAERV
jgi:Conserved hypothetical protein (Lin0512_fam)